ncbi:DUF4139 domain-containing protein [Salinisphaera sp. T31B1]|uniref:DUF4139 domain-containing protein n=1 Tax=Salinisphaera sp. T31B1 TaxID=727963 RepID=UPI003341B0E0
MICKQSANATLAAALVCLLPAAAWAAPNDGASEPVDAMALYNQGAAVVQDTRELSLAAGAQQIGWPVAGRLRTDTLWLQGTGVRLTGFAASTQSDAAADPLAARIGQSVTLVRDDGTSPADQREATLVSASAEAVYVRVDGRIERLTAASPWQITWPVDGSTTQSGGLNLELEADKAGSTPVTATYQIDGPSWQASYTGRFDASTGHLSLVSMAVIDNSGGAHLAADKAWLVAGDIARAGRGGMPQPMMMARSEAKMADSAPEAAGDTYRYQLDEPLDVPAGGVRAVSLMAPLGFDATRRYRFTHGWYDDGRDGARDHAEIRLSFDNDSDRPLPAGVVRVYDGAAEARLMGSDQINDTPTGAPVTLTLGRSFDITSSRQIVSDDAANDGAHERTVKLTLHNAGAQPAAVDVIEQLPQGATIVSSSIGQQKDTPANTGTWSIDLAADSQRQLIYTVRWPDNA